MKYWRIRLKDGKLLFKSLSEGPRIINENPGCTATVVEI